MLIRVSQLLLSVSGRQTSDTSVSSGQRWDASKARNHIAHYLHDFSHFCLLTPSLTLLYDWSMLLMCNVRSPEKKTGWNAEKPQ